jgi:D-3-phosphoglycerate dehydrogenase
LQAEKGLSVTVKTDHTPQQLQDAIGDYEALIVRSATKVTKDVIARGKKLKVIGRAGVGLDNVDLEAATARGIIVMNAPAGNSISTAEHTMSMILSMARNIPQAYASMRKGEWKRSKFRGVELYAKVLGVVGLGRIGTEVAKRARSFGMKVMAFDPFLTAERARQLEVEPVDLAQLLVSADYITFHTPLTEETKGMISREQFAAMKKGVRIVNCARGGIVDEAALIEAVNAGTVAAAAFDVFEQEPLPADNQFIKSDKIIVTPHLGASTEEAQVNVAIEIAECVRDALLGKGIRNAANFPSLEAEASKVLAPWIDLAEKLGSLAGQIAQGAIQKVTIRYSGVITRNDVTPLSLALMKGLLSPVLQETVNFINSLSLAKERGIAVREEKSDDEAEFTSLISLEIGSGKDTVSVCGTLSANNQPRVVRIDDYYVEAVPRGHMLVLQNQDKPGIIGALGTLLGNHHINIAGMTFGRKEAGGKSISVLNIDSPVSPDMLAQIKKLQHILDVKTVKL